MDYLPIKCIDFTSAKSKKKKLDDIIESTTCSQGRRLANEVPKVIKVPNAEEMNTLYKKLSESATKPGVLCLIL